MPWHPYRNLTELVVLLRDVPSMQELICALRNYPDLKVLALGFVGPPMPVLEPQTVVELAHLNTMALHRNSDMVTCLLACLSFPATALIDV